MTDETDWSAIEADFRKSGFLGESTNRFRLHFRHDMEEWFELADRVNDLAQRAYILAANKLPGMKLASPLAIGTQMLPRCLCAFQGAIILAERGLGLESQTLVRGLFETAFWMGYVGKAPEVAIPHLRWETLTSEIGLFEASLVHLIIAEDLKASARKRLSEMRAERDSYEKAPRVEELAQLAGFPKSYFFYKELSGSAAHTSLKSIHSFLQHDDDGDVVGHSIGPDESEVGKAIWLNCNGMILALAALEGIQGEAEWNAELVSLNTEWEALLPFHMRGLA